MKYLTTLVCSTMLSTAIFAETAIETEAENINFDIDKLYVGFGVSHNRIDLSSIGSTDAKASGYQVFAGYEMGSKNGFDLSAEAGVIQSDDFSQIGQDANGIWAAAVIKKELPEVNDKLAALVRIGYGINGDDGLLMGFGAQIRVMPQALIRLEYLNKDLSQSYQLNGVYQF